MKDFIQLNYNIDIEENTIETIDNGISFQYKNRSYDFVSFNRTLEELGDIIMISHELIQKQYPISLIIDNRYGKSYSTVGEQKYILLEHSENETAEMTINEILEVNRALPLSGEKTKLYRNNWSELWCSKIDYFEYQVRSLGKEKKVILNSFTYYIGLAENAISYVGNIQKKYQNEAEDQIVLSHRRLLFPNFVKSYFNPLNFIFDLEVRDLAEYIKSAFFQNIEYAYIEVKALLQKKRFSIYSLHMFYARLLYPSYYFDLYEDIMEREKEENELIAIIEKVDLYEKFLKDIYEMISTSVVIEPIDWILQKKEL